MPGKLFAKLARSGYVGQVVTAGILLTTAALCLFAVIGILKTSPPAAQNMPVTEAKEQEQAAMLTAEREEPAVATQHSGQMPSSIVLMDKTSDNENGQSADAQLLSQLQKSKVTHDFGWQLHPLYNDWRYHNGIDISGGEGQSVPAVMNGKVQQIYTDKQYGLTVVVASGSYIITYSSLASVVVQEDTQVAAGQPLGSMGITTSEPEPHLHLAVQQPDWQEYINPRAVVPTIAE